MLNFKNYTIQKEPLERYFVKSASFTREDWSLHKEKIQRLKINHLQITKITSKLYALKGRDFNNL